MARYTHYGTKESCLHQTDQTLLSRYRKFQDALRRQTVNPLDATSMEEHLENIQHKSIANATEVEIIRELLRYHGWAVLRERKGTHQIPLAELVVSYQDLHSYCIFLKYKRRVKTWTMNKICQAIISMVKFLKAKTKISSLSNLDKMLDDVRAFYSAIARTAQLSWNDRPSLDERRERGEALSFLDIVKVCHCQNWRVKTLFSNFYRKDKHLTENMKKAVRVMLLKEVKRFAVLFILLKYPTRKIEAQRSIIEKSGNTWRLKLSGSNRKSGKFPIDVKLSLMEMQIFRFLRDHDGENVVDLWQPFKRLPITEILKATTLDIAGVGTTVTDLRCAAESHVDNLDYDSKKECENIQRALSYAEGHGENIAKMFYKRNGSSSIMKAWTVYVEKLVNVQEAEADDDNDVSVDQKIIKDINGSQNRWIIYVQQCFQGIQNGKTGSTTQLRKKMVKWSKEEDDELRKQVSYHGTNWKGILENSTVLQERYKTSSSAKTSHNALKNRWKRLKPRHGNSAYTAHKWSQVENDTLEYAVSIYGTNWKQILDNTIMFKEIYNHLLVENARSALYDHWRLLIGEKGQLNYRRKSPKKKSERTLVSAHRRKKKGRHAVLGKSKQNDFRFDVLSEADKWRDKEKQTHEEQAKELLHQSNSQKDENDASGARGEIELGRKPKHDNENHMCGGNNTYTCQSVQFATEDIQASFFESEPIEQDTYKQQNDRSAREDCENVHMRTCQSVQFATDEIQASFFESGPTEQDTYKQQNDRSAREEDCENVHMRTCQSVQFATEDIQASFFESGPTEQDVYKQQNDRSAREEDCENVHMRTCQSVQFATEEIQASFFESRPTEQDVYKQQNDRSAREEDCENVHMRTCQSVRFATEDIQAAFFQSRPTEQDVYKLQNDRSAREDCENVHMRTCQSVRFATEDIQASFFQSRPTEQDVYKLQNNRSAREGDENCRCTKKRKYGKKINNASEGSKDEHAFDACDCEVDSNIPHEHAFDACDCEVDSNIASGEPGSSTLSQSIARTVALNCVNAFGDAQFTDVNRSTANIQR